MREERYHRYLIELNGEDGEKVERVNIEVSVSTEDKAAADKIYTEVNRLTNQIKKIMK